jgi:formyltetrahydrofolate-dependent phosphoribosylglycinamide formyltransferase
VRKKWAVMISGRGSNLAALLELRSHVDIRLVVSSNPEAHGLLRAKRAGVPTALTPFKTDSKGKTRIDWLKLDELLRSRGVTNVFLAGFMKVIPASFVNLWQGRIVNLHPSILPAYPGLESIERAYRDGHDLGLTVHEVTAEVDAGRVICQRRCLKAAIVNEYSLATAEFLVHVDEQRAVKEAIVRW